MSEHFEAERDSGLRSTVIMHSEKELSWSDELYIQDKYWNEFVEFINKIDSERRNK